MNKEEYHHNKLVKLLQKATGKSFSNCSHTMISDRKRYHRNNEKINKSHKIFR